MIIIIKIIKMEYEVHGVNIFGDVGHDNKFTKILYFWRIQRIWFAKDKFGNKNWDWLVMKWFDWSKVYKSTLEPFLS